MIGFGRCVSVSGIAECVRPVNSRNAAALRSCATILNPSATAARTPPV